MMFVDDLSEFSETSASPKFVCHADAGMHICERNRAQSSDRHPINNSESDMVLLAELQLRAMCVQISRVVIEEIAENDWRVRCEKPDANGTLRLGLTTARRVTDERVFKSLPAALGVVRRNMADKKEILVRLIEGGNQGEGLPV